MNQDHIRNFCIIAHIDHGKSTLADRLLEATGTISPREMAEQVLDQMELEREKGITIKATAVRMVYRAPGGQSFQLNLIDTPGHVDFAYEVSRALSACEGAVLVVDASQGIQAQTIAHVYSALEHDLALIPVINKIDLPNADPQGVARQLEEILGIEQDEIIFVSAKEGVGTEAVLEAIVARIPPPRGEATAPLRALIFDSKYDPYKGVIAYVRVVDGQISLDEPLLLMVSGVTVEALELGTFGPEFVPQPRLATGEVGYVATGLKNVRECQVGDTITGARRPAPQSLPGYRTIKPMVFAGLFPVEAKDYASLRDALDKLRLNDASLSYEPETSAALGFGFRAGFLGLLHMDIVRERLEREYGLELLITSPSVEYHVLRYDGSVVAVENPSRLPPAGEIEEIEEPWMKITIVAPVRHLGAMMELATERRGQFQGMEYLEATGHAQGEARARLEYDLPLSEMLVDFYDQLKSRSQGYASLDYTLAGYRPGRLARLDILVNQQPVDALSLIAPVDEAHRIGRALVDKLRSVIPRQLFDVSLQAAIGSRVVARETIRALRKNVLAKCYGGDVSRKRKLLEKQAEGKRRMKRVGQVEIPQEAFTAVLRLER